MKPTSKLARVWRRLTSHESAPKESVTPLSPLAEEIYCASEAGELRQGEIITNFIQLVVDLDSIRSMRTLRINSIEHPYVIVVSEDCDLTQDFNARQRNDVASDKFLPSVLFCEMETAEELRGPPGKRFNKTSWDRVKINKDERYHFLQRIPSEKDAAGIGLPELGIDFKRYFTVPTDEVYYKVENGADRRCRLASPYLEHFSTRFCYFQSRIALPADHESE